MNELASKLKRYAELTTQLKSQQDQLDELKAEKKETIEEMKVFEKYFADPEAQKQMEISFKSTPGEDETASSYNP